MMHYSFEGQERVFRVAVSLQDINMFELNVLTHFPERPYLIPLLRERDEDVQLVYTLHSHITLEQWLRRTAADYHDLLSMLEEIVTILDQTTHHCLRLDQFCLVPSQICYHTVKKRIELIYLPERKIKFSFEQKWQQLLNDLSSIAALSLKPEGLEAFKSLFDSTVNRYERQTALLKVILQWFASRSAAAGSDKSDHYTLVPILKGSVDPLAYDIDPRHPQRGITTKQKLMDPSESAPVMKLRPQKSFFWPNGCILENLINGFNKHKEKRSSLNADLEKSPMSQETFERIQISVAAQHKNVMCKPEAEGTTLLSEQEKLQGKLVLQNQQACKIFELSGPITRIGRNTSLCDVIIDDDITIGRLHAEIHRIDQGFFIKDLDSLNGTYLNEQRLDSQTLYKLKGNDRLRLSEQEILIF